MTRDEFWYEVRRAGVDERAFSLDGGLPAEQYVMTDEGGGRWAICYSERGGRTSLKVFDSEGDALRHLLYTLLSDPTTRTATREQPRK
jgi:hypothetical protein